MNWENYPRPQMRRADWINLNGSWDFFVNDRRCGTIEVPFCPESQLSGINRELAGTDFSEIRYERWESFPKLPEHRRMLLHFGAVDQEASVYVNDRYCGSHEGGYTAFAIDITNALQEGANRIQVQVEDTLSHKYPWGKQKKNRGGMWYTPVSGIWQSVWAEMVPEHYIRSIQIDVDMTGAEISCDFCKENLASNVPMVLFEGEAFPLQNGRVRITPNSPNLWTPETPHLYEFEISYGADRVKSYFALRELSIKEVDGVQRLCLNGEPFFFNGLLDQGYFSDGIYTPKEEACFTRDIKAMKELGFNTLRKHIKVEPEAFYYECDRLGMVVFQDMVQAGDYSFFRDTVLPTIGITKLCDKNLHKDETTRRNFYRGMEETVAQLRNHPSIVLWTIFNEGWGQFEADRAYEKLKSLDGSRFIDATSGWFWQKRSDVDSYHIYFRKLKLKKQPKNGEKRPTILSEYGGYVYKVPGHAYNCEKDYGYRTYKTREAYQKALCTLQEDVMKLRMEGLSAAIYTQVSDVEDEVNGLFTYDREALKIEIPNDLY